MPDLKLSALTTIPAVDRAADLLYIVDTSGGTSNKTTANQLLGISGAPVGDTDTQTLTNKTITSPTISSPVLSGTITGTYTIGGTPTFPSAVVTLTGAQTLTNKILTSPTINTPTISNATITANAITGFTTSNTGTIYGIPVTTGVINTANTVNGASLVAASVGSTALATNAVQANQIATSAITLGYAQITANFTTAGTNVQVTGLTTTVTIPAGGRRIKITGWATNIQDNTAVTNVTISIWDGVVGSGTLLAFNLVTIPGTSYSASAAVFAVITPSPGSKTYNIGLTAGGGTAQITASATSPAFILVEAI